MEIPVEEPSGDIDPYKKYHGITGIYWTYGADTLLAFTNITKNTDNSATGISVEVFKDWLHRRAAYLRMYRLIGGTFETNNDLKMKELIDEQTNRNKSP